MGLSEAQEEEMYKQTVAAAVDIRSVCERIEKGNKKLEEHAGRIRDLELEHAFWKGKLGAFVLGFTLFVSVLWQGILWIWSHLGGKS